MTGWGRGHHSNTRDAGNWFAQRPSCCLVSCEGGIGRELVNVAIWHSWARLSNKNTQKMTRPDRFKVDLRNSKPASVKLPLSDRGQARLVGAGA